jgi:hypothetical protein
VRAGHYEATYSAQQAENDGGSVRLLKDRTHDSYFAFPDPQANRIDVVGGRRVAMALSTELVISKDTRMITVCLP